MDTKRLRTLLAAALFVPAAASAELAVTTHGVNMRAGPDVSYPQVAFLGRGVTVDVVGCVEGWQWCDVVAGPNRGWVSAAYLSYNNYYNQPTIIGYGGPALGIPLISFSIGPYWDSYYRARPWYHNRSYWYNHRIAPAPAWREPPRYAHDRGWHGGNPNAHWNGGNPNANFNRGNVDRRAGVGIPGPYTRAEGGTHDRIQGMRPNDQSNPNQQQ
jgi:uncharacterized protein YraI